MNVRRAAVILTIAIIAASCSEKPAAVPPADTNASDAPREATGAPAADTTKGEAALRPPTASKIGKDCVTLVRGTKVVRAAADCPGCPAGGSEALTFRQVKTDAVSCSGDTCNVVVTICAVFNPGSGETLAGGLTAWIPAEQRSVYLNGQTPPDEQEYRVRITYKHRGGVWRAVEFDRAAAE